MRDRVHLWRHVLKLSLVSLSFAVVGAADLVGESSLYPDTIVLQDGRVFSGTIIAETDESITIQIPYNKEGTIFRTEEVPKTLVARETRNPLLRAQAAQAKELLKRYSLNPDQEYLLSFYDQGVAEFEQYLATFPDSDYAPQIKRRLEEWLAERERVRNGEIKVAGAWYPYSDQIRTSQRKIKTLRGEVAQWEQKKKQCETALNNLRSAIDTAQTSLHNVRRELGRIPPPKRPGDRRELGDAYDEFNYNRLVAQERALSRDIVRFQSDLTSYETECRSVDASLRRATEELTAVQEDFKSLLASLIKPPPPPPPPPPPEPPELPWWQKYWKWMAAGALLLLAVFAFKR